MGSERTIVVVEDEPAIALPLVDRLEREGFRTVHAADGRAGLDAARADGVALVVLDLMLPALNGTEVLATLRAEGLQVPVICLTAKTAERDRVDHLLAGADDYVTKPFSLDELMARVTAILRRTAPATDSVEIGGLTIDLDGHTVRRADRTERLSTLEAAILACLLERRGRATSRSQILDAVWGRYAAVTDRTIDFHVKNLRRKLEERPDKPTLIVTDHGVGYRFTA